ncbi:MAG: phosphatidate cytidylyltransferase [Eubacteriales bacterium]|nr:phosphatidate cytidylyltransferase [Eubacteriales bacterium]
MAVRIISSAVGIALCIGIMFFGENNPVVVNIAISLVTALMCGELLSAKGLHKNLKVSIPAIAFGFAMPFLSTTDYVFIPLYVFAVVLFVVSVLCHRTIKSEDTLFVFGGVTLISLSMASFTNVVCGPNGLAPLFGECNPATIYPTFWVIFVLAIPWLSDTGAYFTGMLLGKHKLCPEISPKKTVEGAIGGTICGMLCSVAIGFIFMWAYDSVTINFVPLIIVGIINPIISIFGDLTFSIIKRACGIKDYGSIMPGHGGMLDRFDSIILCAPLVYLISQYFTVIS